MQSIRYYLHFFKRIIYLVKVPILNLLKRVYESFVRNEEHWCKNSVCITLNKPLETAVCRTQRPSWPPRSTRSSPLHSFPEIRNKQFNTGVQVRCTFRFMDTVGSRATTRDKLRVNQSVSKSVSECRKGWLFFANVNNLQSYLYKLHFSSFRRTSAFGF